MKSIVLFGAGSPLIQEYEETCRRLGASVAFGVNNYPSPAQASPALPVKEISELSADDLTLPYLVPIFTPANRKHAVAHAESLGFREAATLVDPTTTMPGTMDLGPGCFINSGCVLGVASRFGRHTTINRASTIGHHNDLGDFVSIGPGCVTCGNVTIGEGSMIGAGSVILPGVTIGEGCQIGAGSVVGKDLAAHMRLIQNRRDHVTSLKP